MDERQKRMTHNEALFREVNERINETADGLGGAGTFEYFCECANADCTFQITMTPEQYEAVRADPAQFAVLPLHFTPEVEILISKREGHWIVRKTGEAGEFAEQLDPRSRQPSAPG